MSDTMEAGAMSGIVETVADAEKLADDILKAAGSGLRHYTPYNKAKIIGVAAEAIERIRRSQALDKLGELDGALLPESLSEINHSKAPEVTR
jgi:hypothetical protein